MTPEQHRDFAVSIVPIVDALFDACRRHGFGAVCAFSTRAYEAVSVKRIGSYDGTMSHALWDAARELEQRIGEQRPVA